MILLTGRVSVQYNQRLDHGPHFMGTVDVCVVGGCLGLGPVVAHSQHLPCGAHLCVATLSLLKSGCMTRT
jgi:hypothetical protein